MDIVITVGGKWHAIQLAAQCYRRNILKLLITSAPLSHIPKTLPENKVKSIPWHFYSSKLLNALWLNNKFYGKLSSYFGKFVSNELRKIDEPNIFVSWAGFGLEPIRQYRKINSTTKIVLERGSAHIQSSLAILTKEYERYGFQYQYDQYNVDRELEEYALSDFIFIPSSFAYKTFLNKGIDSKKLIKVPYGVDIMDFKPLISKPNKSGKFTIVCVGKVCLGKGQQYLLESVKILNKKYYPVDLYLVGPVDKDIKSILNKYDEYITQVGKLSHKLVSKLLPQCDVMVLPTLTEGFARVIFESMASGLPVITTPNSGGEDIINNGENGFIIPIRDSKSIVEKIVYLIENPDVSITMGLKARNTVENGYSWEDYGDRMHQEYQKILNY